MRKQSNPESHFIPGDQNKHTFPRLIPKSDLTINRQILTKKLHNTILEIDDDSPTNREFCTHKSKRSNSTTAQHDCQFPVTSDPNPEPVHRRKYQQDLMHILEQRILQSRNLKAWARRHSPTSLDHSLHGSKQKYSQRPAFTKQFYESLVRRQQHIHNQSRPRPHPDHLGRVSTNFQRTLGQNSLTKPISDFDCEVISSNEKKNPNNNQRVATVILPTQSGLKNANVQSADEQKHFRRSEYDSPSLPRTKRRRQRTPESVAIVDATPEDDPDSDFVPVCRRVPGGSIVKSENASPSNKFTHQTKLNRKIAKIRKARKQKRGRVFGIATPAHPVPTISRQPRRPHSPRSKNQPITNFFASSRRTFSRDPLLSVDSRPVAYENESKTKVRVDRKCKSQNQPGLPTQSRVYWRKTSQTVSTNFHPSSKKTTTRK